MIKFGADFTVFAEYYSKFSNRWKMEETCVLLPGTWCFVLSHNIFFSSNIMWIRMSYGVDMRIVEYRPNKCHHNFSAPKFSQMLLLWVLTADRLKNNPKPACLHDTIYMVYSVIHGHARLPWFSDLIGTRSCTVYQGWHGLHRRKTM